VPVITEPPWYVTFPGVEVATLGALAAVSDPIAARALEGPGFTMSVREMLIRNRTSNKRTGRAAIIGIPLSHGESQFEMFHALSNQKTTVLHFLSFASGRKRGSNAGHLVI